MLRTEVEKEIPLCVSLPIEVINPEQTFPFLNTTLADLGIEESSVKERVVWVDTKRTQVRSRSGKLKEKEVTVLEVRVKAQHPGQEQCQEVLYSTESHTDRAYCRSGVDILPWRHTHPGLTKNLDISPDPTNFTHLTYNIQFPGRVIFPQGQTIKKKYNPIKTGTNGNPTSFEHERQPMEMTLALDTQSKRKETGDNRGVPMIK